jgi:Tfp pilus assembly protein PilF
MQLTLSETLARAAGSFQAGHMAQAEALCRAILRADAGHLIALHLLAAVQTRLGRLQDALASYDRVLAIKPDYPEALNNRGTALHDLHRVEEALASYERALWRSSQTMSRPSTTAATRCATSNAARRRSQATSRRWRSTPAMSRRW